MPHHPVNVSPPALSLGLISPKSAKSSAVSDKKLDKTDTILPIIKKNRALSKWHNL